MGVSITVTVIPGNIHTIYYHIIYHIKKKGKKTKLCDIKNFFKITWEANVHQQKKLQVLQKKIIFNSKDNEPASKFSNLTI